MGTICRLYGETFIRRMTELIEETGIGLGLDVDRVRGDFPILGATVRGHPLVYLDNAATSQKPRVVIEALTGYYTAQNANIHRGIHYLSEEATEAYERARARVGQFINAADPAEIVFVRGTTEAISLVAHSFGRRFINAGDAIVLSQVEHHSNIVPWQLVAEERGATIEVIPIDDDGLLDLETYEKLLSERVKIVAISHLSNALGIVYPIGRMIAMAHDRGIPVAVDGAQAAPHMKVDVQELDCDFYMFSGHKVYGPTGVGVLFGKRRWMDEIPPYLGGGGAIRSVDFSGTKFLDPPGKFEAGTPNIAGALGLHVALDYVDSLGLANIEAYETDLYEYALGVLSEIDDLRIFGRGPSMASVISFLLGGVHAHDISTFLDSEGIAIRAGHHCAQPLMRRLGIAGTARASFSFYNTKFEVDKLVRGIRNVRRFFFS